MFFHFEFKDKLCEAPVLLKTTRTVIKTTDARKSVMLFPKALVFREMTAIMTVME